MRGLQFCAVVGLTKEIITRHNLPRSTHLGVLLYFAEPHGWMLAIDEKYVSPIKRNQGYLCLGPTRLHLITQYKV